MEGITQNCSTIARVPRGSPVGRGRYDGGDEDSFKEKLFAPAAGGAIIRQCFAVSPFRDRVNCKEPRHPRSHRFLGSPHPKTNSGRCIKPWSFGYQMWNITYGPFYLPHGQLSLLSGRHFSRTSPCAQSCFLPSYPQVLFPRGLDNKHAEHRTSPGALLSFPHTHWYYMEHVSYHCVNAE